MYRRKAMPKNKNEILEVQGLQISLFVDDTQQDYISLTDIARYKNSDEPDVVVRNWMRLRNTIEYLGIWEQLHNPNFNPTGYERFRNESVENAFTMSPKKWKDGTGAIGITSKAGRHGGGTFAHSDIAFKFSAWISVEFELYIIKDYQRLKKDEQHKYSLDWNVKRILAKANYKIHTDAIKENLIPEDLSKEQVGYVYANEADLLNVVLFGKTAKQWREENNHNDKSLNMRDFATIEQLLVMSNLENTNALLIQQGKNQPERLQVLRGIAVTQLRQLTGLKSINQLKILQEQPLSNYNKYF